MKQLKRELKDGVQGAEPDRQGLHRVPAAQRRRGGGRRRCAHGRGQKPLCKPADAFRTTLAADFSANVLRNVWAYMIIFCGHFPDQTYTFSEEEAEDETRGGFYVRQLLGAANIEGSPLFHVISGNLGYQVEHHLYPDMPSTRYGEIAPRVRAICEKYALPYNTGPLFKQLGTVQRTILRLAFPGGKPRPKPGPYRGVSLKLWPGSPFPLGATTTGSDQLRDLLGGCRSSSSCVSST